MYFMCTSNWIKWQTPICEHECHNRNDERCQHTDGALIVWLLMILFTDFTESVCGTMMAIGLRLRSTCEENLRRVPWRAAASSKETCSGAESVRAPIFTDRSQAGTVTGGVSECEFAFAFARSKLNRVVAVMGIHFTAWHGIASIIRLRLAFHAGPCRRPTPHSPSIS